MNKNTKAVKVAVGKLDIITSMRTYNLFEAEKCSVEGWVQSINSCVEMYCKE